MIQFNEWVDIFIPTAEDYRSAIQRAKRAALARGQDFVVLCAGQVDREMGSYPSTNNDGKRHHRLPLLLRIMKEEMRHPDDAIAFVPKRGQGARMTFIYNLTNRREQFRGQVQPVR